jgi:c-di-GMP-binding flagellar brake protein YcgR
MVERRNFQRVPFATEAEINCNGKKYHGELLNISLQGALIHGKETIPFEEGDICELSIHLSGSEITLQFDVNLVHRERKRLGFRFIGEDTETMTHLRRLLELNIGSSEIIDKEISFWLKNV